MNMVLTDQDFAFLGARQVGQVFLDWHDAMLYNKTQNSVMICFISGHKYNSVLNYLFDNKLHFLKCAVCYQRTFNIVLFSIFDEM